MSTETSEAPSIEQDEEQAPMSAYQAGAREAQRILEAQRRRARARNKASRQSRKRQRR